MVRGWSTESSLPSEKIVYGKNNHFLLWDKALQGPVSAGLPAVSGLPFPVEDLGQVLAHFVDIILVFHQFIVHLLD